MGEGERARPARNQNTYLLDITGRVIGWPSRSGARAEQEQRPSHFSEFFTRGGRTGGEPERDLLLASRGGLEIDAWWVQEDGSPVWARLVMTPLEDQARRALGFVLVLIDLGHRAREQPGEMDSAPSVARDPEPTPSTLRAQLAALRSVLDDGAGEVAENVKAKLSLIARDVERLSAAVGNREDSGRRSGFPTKFDRRKR